MLNYGHKRVSKGQESVVVSNLVLSKEDIIPGSILYVFSVPDIDRTITSLKIYFDKINGLKALVGVFSKEGRSLIKYNIAKTSLEIDFENEEGVDFTPLLAGKSFKEIIGVGYDRDYFLGLNFVSSAKDDGDAAFILKYI